jgi:hypothetical protein
VALGAVYALATRNTRGAWFVAALVVSHWLLDAIVHVPDLPLSPGGGTMMGLGLWQSRAATMAVEVPIFALGVWLYVRSTRAKNRVGAYGLVGLVGFLALIYGRQPFRGPATQRQTAIAWVGKRSGCLWHGRTGWTHIAN